MRIVTLMEDTTMDFKLRTQHGLCIYMETESHKLLFDLGCDDKFIKNARHLDIDLSDVDTVIISHGHAGHIGGLKPFMAINNKAKIYVRESSLEPHYAKSLRMKNNGTALSDIDKSRLIFTDDLKKIDHELTLFSNAEVKYHKNSLNGFLYRKSGEDFANDSFDDEQHLLIKSGGRYVLVSGCAHKGIVNVIERAKEICHSCPKYVFSGFHVYDPAVRKTADNDFMVSMARSLNEYDTKFYTYHCINKKSFKIFKNILKDKLKFMPLSCDFPILN